MRARARDDVAIAAELDAAPLRGGQCCLGSLGDAQRFVLGYHGHDAHRQPVRVRHVGRNKVDAGFFQAEQEVGVARQSIELCDDKPRPVQAAHGKSFRQFWPIRRAPFCAAR